MAKEKVCRECSRVVKGDICPSCKSTELTTNWKGVVLIFDPDSEIAKKMDADAPGKYAIEVTG